MTPEETKVLNAIRGDVGGLIADAKSVPQPMRGILTANLWLIDSKVRWLLGEREAGDA